MTVTSERFEDVSGPDDPHWEYRGTLYRFGDGERVLLARVYDDEPETLFVLSWAGERFRQAPRHPLFRAAVAHARLALGVAEVRVLLPRGYVRVEAE